MLKLRQHQIMIHPPPTDFGAKGIMMINYSQQRPPADLLRANLETRSKTGTGDPSASTTSPT